jgi:MoxR-like ATPase
VVVAAAHCAAPRIHQIIKKSTMDTQNTIKAILAQLGAVIVGKPRQLQDALACVLAGGHLLIDDVPGVGKTTLAHALAKTLGLQFSRVQFTSDLMPGDLSGVSVYEQSSARFVFHPGPLFTQILLADEINRASPKTQSALLEAMEEQQLSIEGQTRPLPQPFFVIATQNPLDQIGTQALPESQLDRFLMRISLGYPDRQAERQLLLGQNPRTLLDTLPAAVSPAQLQQLQAAVQAVHASNALLDYLQDLVDATRSGQWFVQGLSPRAGMALLRVAKARALLQGRNYVAPDDVQEVIVPAIAHRLVALPRAGRDAQAQVRAMVEAVPLP